MSGDELLSVAGLAAGYRRPSPLSPIEVTEFFLDRIRRLDGSTESMVTVTEEIARKAAAKAQQRISEGDPSPLLGVPIVLKDLIDVRSVPTTAGSAVLADNIPTRSSPVWRRLERAGAILLGKANTHEFAYGGTTEPTTNPWNPGRLVGGSSGGPAAALAAGLIPLAFGSDTAGSIRIPSNLCGVAGLKPTNGTVSRAGVVPLAPSLDVVGPMGHHPLDLAMAQASISSLPGFTDRFESALRTIRQRVESRDLRVIYLESPGPMSSGVSAAYKRTIGELSEFGSVTAVAFEEFGESVMANFTILGVEAVIVHKQWEDHRHLYTPYVLERLAQAAQTLAVDYERARRAARSYRVKIDRLLDECDVLVVPGVPFPAPGLDVSTVTIEGVVEDRDTSMCRNTAFANLSGHPALALPVGFEEGLPVGVQLVGQRRGDAELLAVGAVLADVLGTQTVADNYRL